MLSSFTHGKKHTRLKEWADRAAGKNKTPILLGRTFDDEEKISFCIDVLTTLQHMLFRSLMVLFAEEMENTDQFKEKLVAFKNDDQNFENNMIRYSRAYTQDIKEMLNNACALFLVRLLLPHNEFTDEKRSQASFFCIYANFTAS